MKIGLFIGAISVISFSASGIGAPEPTTPPRHERLRLKNTFKSPEEVVNYYCARDASGFVWSGILDAERTAFTSWTSPPEQDSFYVAKKYEIEPSRPVGNQKDHVLIEVKYQIISVSDAHGTRVPVVPPNRLVTFELKRVNGVWKIERPLASEISPVVLESRFPGNP